MLTGDCNCRPDSRPYEVIRDCLGDAREGAATVHGPCETYHGYDRETAKRIDYVFASPSLSPAAQGVLPDVAPDWQYPSDHWPVLARFETGGEPRGEE